MFFDIMKTYRVKIGLWVDLTYTKRFYDQSEVEKHGAKYLKLGCRGHDEAPTAEQTKLFIDIVGRFIRTNPLDHVAVHCTHGFNRTGFVICAYLIEHEQWSFDAAFKKFADVRPPGIYKKDYITELHRRYGDPEEQIPMEPELPDWCDEEETEDDDGGSGPSQKRRRKEFHKKDPVFMEGVPKVHPLKDRAQIEQIQHLVQRMCSFPPHMSGFPGSQPVSLTMENISRLEQAPYMVSWKADGTRYLLLINGINQVYFLDRDNSVFQADDIFFPCRKIPDHHLEDTLCDGEMVLDEIRDPSGNVIKRPRFLIYDIIKFRGEDVGKCDLPRRFLCIEREVVGPLQKALEEQRLDRQKMPFSVRKKDFWEVQAARKILHGTFAKTLSHEPDGLIFQPRSEPYTPGRCDSVLKWKPPSHNSVDFKLQIVRESREGFLATTRGFLYVQHLKQPFAEIDTKGLKQYDGKIIECSFDIVSKKWKFMRERTDKSLANAYRTAVNVCESIRNPVTEEYLFDFVEQNAWKPPIVPSMSSNHHINHQAPSTSSSPLFKMPVPPTR
ncbi:unnamed protein product [Cyprideis torosa]|uniref:mRNA-capping enzyme n=1 Tax=Cyprideis torosa TaxID=163714 RepID=A0A7R8ZJW0_9CRUS|nr:unnamed protein product [Cyprideis torosa]CAG0879045.1 unnamed protein product [Cyprideis torosa]